jgi:hypothetical protein
VTRIERTEPRWASLLDILALVLLLLTAWALVAGGVRVTIGRLEVSATSWPRLAMEAAIVLVLRYGLTNTLAPTRAQRRRFVLAYLVFLVTLACTSTQRRVGDGGEYLAMTLNLSRLRPPAISDAEMGDIERTFAALGGTFAGVPLVNPDFRGRDGRQDLIHFWLYSLLAAPWVWVARGLALPVNVCFTFVNILLLALALWVVSGQVRQDVALLLFAGPIIWWTDKGHTEAFTFALLAIAAAQLSAAPWWSLVVLGAAAAQNPAIAAALPMVGLAVLAARPVAWRDRRMWLGAAGGAALAALHPLYYWMRLGRLSLLGGITIGEVPSFAGWSAPMLDPNLGILINFPWLTLALVAAIVALAWRSAHLLRTPPVLVSVAVSAVFLLSFSQIPNVNHGGTPGISRYGLWLVPMTLPVFALCDGREHRPRLAWLGAITLASCLWCVLFFHPRAQADYLQPTAFARILWTRFPSVDNPLPEVFIERLIGHGDESWLPIATSHCEKVLLLGDGRPEPPWPVPCAPVRAPWSCQSAGSHCYANLSRAGYRFATAPRQTGYAPGFGQATWVWTETSAAAVRRKLAEVDWGALKIGRFTDPTPIVRRFDSIDWVYMLRSDRQFLVYLSRPGTHAVLRIETAAPMSGRLVDLETGATLQAVSAAPRFLTLDVPGPCREAVLVLTRADRISTVDEHR